MKALFALLLSSTALLAHASTVYQYVGSPDGCGWPAAEGPSCPGALHATLTLRDDGTPERVDYSWRGYREGDPNLSLTIQRHSLAEPGWTEVVLSDYEGYDVFVRQRYTPVGGLYNYVSMGYDSPDRWVASSGDYTGQYISVNTGGSSFLSLDAYWFASGRLSRVPEPAPLLLTVPLLGFLGRLRPKAGGGGAIRFRQPWTAADSDSSWPGATHAVRRHHSFGNSHICSSLPAGSLKVARVPPHDCFSGSPVNATPRERRSR